MNTAGPGTRSMRAARAERQTRGTGTQDVGVGAGKGVGVEPGIVLAGASGGVGSVEARHLELWGSDSGNRAAQIGLVDNRVPPRPLAAGGH